MRPSLGFRVRSPGKLSLRGDRTGAHDPESLRSAPLPSPYRLQWGPSRAGLGSLTASGSCVQMTFTEPPHVPETETAESESR